MMALWFCLAFFTGAIVGIAGYVLFRDWLDGQGRDPSPPSDDHDRWGHV